jgi:uncharacterized protein YecE (DUF72 family)
VSVDDEQFDMFGTPGEAGAFATPLLGPASLSDDWAALNAHMPKQLYLGTSSWSFPGWTGIIYDRECSNTTLAQHGLRAYANFGPLKTVCIDRGYYGPIAKPDFQRYCASVPDDFRFIVKADGAVTQSSLRSGENWLDNPQFLNAKYATRNIVAPYAEGLDQKASVLLFQFPPVNAELRRQPTQFAERLHDFVTALPAGIRYAIEIRDAQLIGPWCARAVRESGAHYCIGLHPRMPPLLQQRSLMAAASSGPLIVRWNLHPNQRYEVARSHYAPFDKLVDEDRSTRHALAKLCRESLASRREVFVIANNKAEGSAPLSLLALGQGITARSF